MRVNVLGAGPAGLYLSILMKRADPGHEIRVLERNHPDATFGWGVVFSEGSLDELEHADYESYVTLTEAWARWDPIDVRYRDTVTRVRGNSFSGVGRRRLLNILQERARRLGVELVFEREVESLEPYLDADLVVGADGANSLVRRTLAAGLRPHVEHAASKYAWFGAEFAFPVFTYIFKQTEWGLFQAHCYPYDESRSTMVLLLSRETWERAGLDELDEEGSLELCERVFAAELGGRRMLSNRSLWTDFPWIRCESWHEDHCVILGDAAHTAHWSIGSGTKLALEDAIALAKAFVRHPGALSSAFAEFELERQPAVERLQEASRVSCDYFQQVQRYFAFEPDQFTYQLMTRTPRITHTNLSVRDAEFVRGVESRFWERAGGRRHYAAPPPLFAPFRLRSLELANRLVFMEGRADLGAGLVVGELHAVTPEGRISPETPVDIGPPPADGVLALRLGHAGRRAGCRPRRLGVDRPLPAAERWPLVSASALAHAPWMPVPMELDRAGSDRVREAFAAAAAAAARLGHRLLLLDFAQGGLLASFLSPLTNRRSDGYGGELESRLRYPLEVLEAVRAAWPEELPLALAYTAADNARGGLVPAEALAAARAFHERGADLLLVLTGQTVAEARPEYGRGYGLPYADRVRNEAGVPVIAYGQITTLDEVNTAVAAGRADLCVLDCPRGNAGPRELT